VNLTPRERQIAIMISQGKRGKEIAHELQLAETTIKTYSTRLYHKVGVERRSELAAWVARSELAETGTMDRLRAIATHYPFTGDELREVLALLLARTAGRDRDPIPFPKAA
jgi:DNA-binding CsgD family transcriptional regulator